MNQSLKSKDRVYFAYQSAPNVQKQTKHTQSLLAEEDKAYKHKPLSAFKNESLSQQQSCIVLQHHSYGSGLVWLL